MLDLASNVNYYFSTRKWARALAALKQLPFVIRFCNNRSWTYAKYLSDLFRGQT